jgi:putative aldouronate transport system permease protein
MTRTKNRITVSRGDHVFHVVNTAIMTLICIVILYPLYYVVVASVTDPVAIQGGELLLYPKKLYFDGYVTALHYGPLLTGYKNSIIYTLVGTLINIAATIPGAYALSRKDMAGRNGIMFIMTFTMFFSGGMIPLYMLVRNLRMMNTIWALVLPGGVSVFNLIVVRTFYQSNIPDSLLEAAKIDGCSDLRFFFRVVLPLSSTIIAVMVVFYAVNHWNSYFSAIMYLNARSKMPLQAILRDLLIENTITVDMRVNPAEAVEKMKRADQLKYCVIILASLPVMVVYPLAQKHFTQGVLIGSIKE